jgi:hypothetical protein
MTLVVDDESTDGQQSWPMDSDDDDDNDDTLSLQSGGDSLDGISLTSSNMGSVKVLFTDQLEALHLLLDSPENGTPTTSLARGRFLSFDEDSLDSTPPDIVLRDELYVADAAASLSTFIWRVQQAVSNSPSKRQQWEQQQQQQQQQQQKFDREQCWDDDDDDDDSDDEGTTSLYSSSFSSSSSSSSASWGCDTTEATPSACDISSSCRDPCISTNKQAFGEKKQGIPGHVSLNDHHTMYLNVSSNVHTHQQAHVSQPKWGFRFRPIMALLIVAFLFRLASNGGVLFNNGNNGNLITSASKSDVIALPKQQSRDYCAPLLSDSVMYLATASWREIDRGDTMTYDATILEFVTDHQETTKKFSEYHDVASSKVNSSSNAAASKSDHAWNAIWCAIKQGISRRPRRTTQSSRKDDQAERAPVLSAAARRALIARAFL